MGRLCPIHIASMLSAALSLPGAPVAATAQTIVQSFDGDSGPVLAGCQPATTHCSRQPEIDVAANGKRVVQTTWQNVRTSAPSTASTASDMPS